jgi:hypothetical protein
MDFWRSDLVAPIVFAFLVEVMILGWVNYVGMFG